MHTPQPPIHRTQAQIEDLVHTFEACTLPPREFNHHAHMTVALWYLSQYPFDEAVAHTRASIQRYAAAHGHHTLYNETITLFWLKLLRHFMDVTPVETPLPDLVYQALTRLGSMRYAYSHYSREQLFSEPARRSWVDPDLLPLPFTY